MNSRTRLTRVTEQMHREEPRSVTVQPGEQEQYAAEQEELVAEAFENVVRGVWIRPPTWLPVGRLTDGAGSTDGASGRGFGAG